MLPTRLPCPGLDRGAASEARPFARQPSSRWPLQFATPPSIRTRLCGSNRSTLVSARRGGTEPHAAGGRGDAFERADALEIVLGWADARYRSKRTIGFRLDGDWALARRLCRGRGAARTVVF